MEREKKSRT